MSIQHLLDRAVATCGATCEIKDHCNDDSVHSWDLAVGWYAGSLASSDAQDSGEGRFLHHLAEKRCKSFNTCDGLRGQSHVNIEMLDLFSAGQEMLGLGKCSDAKKVKERISRLMLVPLLQDALWHAHINDIKPEELMKERHAAQRFSAGAATVAAAILPQIHFCDPQAAYSVYDNLRTGHDATFSTVKHALESTYPCLGIKCEDVGGLYQGKAQQYVEGAEPCFEDVEHFDDEPYGSETSTASKVREEKKGPSKLEKSLIVTCAILGSIILLGISYWASAYVKKRRNTTIENSSRTEGWQEPPLKADQANFA